MAKFMEGTTAYSGRLEYAGSIFPGSLAERMGDRLTRIREVFRRITSPDEAISINPSGIRGAFEEVRDRGYLDIHRNAR